MTRREVFMRELERAERHLKENCESEPLGAFLGFIALKQIRSKMIDVPEEGNEDMEELIAMLQKNSDNFELVLSGLLSDGPTAEA